LAFAALVVGSAACRAAAQQVPGRELLEFPIAVGAEAPALASLTAGGLWNPALVAPTARNRFLVSAAALNTPIAQGVSAQHLGANYVLSRSLLAALAITRAQVSDLVRTDDDPSSVGPEIPYGTTIVSAALAGRRGALTAGAALRYRRGTADAFHAAATSIDLGLRLDSTFGLPLRLGASSFLFSPGREADEPLSVAAAAEYPVARDSTHEVDVGYSFLHTARLGQEHYVYAAARWHRLDGRVGIAHHDGMASTTRRVRLGLGLQYARYLVGLAREESGVGLGASYQFTLTSTFK
jgi:hypothetical protein